MKEKILNIMRDYQKEFIESEEIITIGNYSRQMGKSFALIGKIFYEEPRVCFYISNYLNVNVFERFLKYIIEVFKECGVDLVESVNLSRDLAIVIKYKNGNITHIYDYCKMIKIERRGMNLPSMCDLAVFDEVLPMLNIPSRKYISTLSTNANLQDLFPKYLNKSVKIINYGLKKGIESRAFERLDVANMKNLMSEKNFRREIDILDEYKEVFDCEQTLEKHFKDCLDDFKKTKLDDVKSRREKILIIKEILNLRKELSNGI